MTLENKKFYDINKNDVGVIAGAFLEEGTTDDIRKRINISDLYPEERIEKDNWNYNEHSDEEKKATINIFDLGKKECNLVIWISPEDGGKTYKEGRLNIQFPVFGNNEWAIYGKHMPLVYDRFESIDLAKRLLENGGKTIDPIVEIEDVRLQPIGFKIDVDWLKKCRELMPEFEDIWGFIEDGKDVENKIRVEKDVKVAMEIANGDNYFFESLMSRMGNQINAEGGHGGSWNSGIENGIGIIISVGSNGEIVYQSGSIEGLTKCDDCGCYHEGKKCPLCHK